MKSLIRNASKGLIVLFLIVIAIGQTTKCLAQGEIYPTAQLDFSGATVVCQNTPAPDLVFSFDTGTCGISPFAFIDITVTWYSNSTNSTSGGVQVLQQVSTTATTTYNYSAPTSTAGTVYYYVVVSWGTDVNSCVSAATLTSNEALGVVVNATPPAVIITPTGTSLCQNNIYALSASSGITSSVSSGPISEAIPDFSAPGATHSLLVSGIPAGAVINSIFVEFNIAHLNVGDLVINLKAPNNNVLNFVNRRGGTGDDFINTVVSSTGVNLFSAGAAPFTGTFAADASLGIGASGNTSNAADFNSLYGTPNGNWVISARDLGLNGIGGTINSWSITINWSYPITWSPVTDLFSNAGATIAYLNGQILSTVYLKPASTGTISYTATATGAGGCQNSNSVIFTVDPTPSVVATPVSQTLCSATAITQINISNPNSIPGTTFTWTRTTPAGLSGIANSGSGTSISGTFTNSTSSPITTTFTIIATVGNCSSTTTVTVTVNPVPTVSVTNTNQTVCSGTALANMVITNPNAVSGTTFSWTRDNTVNLTGIAANGNGSPISGTMTNVTNVQQTSVFTINATVAGCSSATTATIAVNPIPTVSATPATQTVCSGIAITQIDITNPNAVSGTTFTWTRTTPAGLSGIANSGSGTSISGSFTNSTTAAISTTFTITANAGSCTSTTNVTVTVNPVPTVSVTNSNQTLCSGIAITNMVITNPNGISGTTFAWSRTNTTNLTGIASSGSGSPIAGTLTNNTNVLQTTVFTISATAGICSSSTTATININPRPTISATPVTQSSCSGTAISQINITNPNAVAGTTFSWTRTNTVNLTGIASSGSGSSISGILTNTTTVQQTTVFTLTATAGSCTSTSTTVSIIVDPLPTVSNAGSPQTICSNSTATLNANNPTVGTGIWSVQSGPSTSTTQFSSVSNRTAIFTPAGGAGTYVLSWSISSGVCTASASTVTITVNAGPTISNAGSPQTICNNTSATLSANTPSVGTAVWSIISGPSTNISQISNVNNPSAIFTPAGGAGTYQLRWTITNGSCVSFSNVNITVSAIPGNPNISFNETVQQSSQTIIICGPIGGGGQNDIDIYNYSTPSGSNWIWQYSSNGGPWTTAGVPPNTTQYVIASFAGIIGTHQFQMILTTSGGCTVYSNIITLTVQPVTAIGGTSFNACSGTAFSSAFSGFPSGTTYTWTSPSVTGGMTGGSSGSGATLTGNLTNNSATNQTATYTVTPVYPSGNNPSCTVTFQAVATIYPKTTITISGTAASVCFSASSQISTLTYSATTGNPTTYSITWNASPANSFAAVTNAALPVSPISINVPANTNAGTYTGNLTVSNGVCSSASTAFTITVNAIPTITNATTAANVCYSESSQTTTLTYSATSGSPTTYSISWNAAPANSFVAVTNSVLPASPIIINIPAGTNPGTYTGNLTVRNNNGCVSAIKPFTILVQALPTANWSTSTNAICTSTSSQIATLTYSSTTNSPNTYSITWNPVPANTFSTVTNAAFSGSSGGGTISITVPANTASGIYTGNITVRNAAGCVSSPSQSFTINIGAIPVMPASITGITQTCDNISGLIYSVPLVSGATSYNWAFPAGWSVVSGTGTNSITVNALTGSQSGNISVSATNYCGSSASLLMSIVVYAKGTWLGSTTDWHSPSNWCGGVPTASTNVLIPFKASSIYPVISAANAMANDITIGAGASINVNNKILQVSGIITNNSGSFNLLDGTLELNGSGIAQNISGSLFVGKTIKELLISNMNGVNLTGVNDSLKISGIIKFGTSNTILNTNNNLTLLSNASGTASVGDMTNNGVNSGNNIIGNVTVERFIPNHFKAWQFLAVPTKGQTVNAAWQEGNTPLSNSNKPGYGTIITSNVPGAVGLGFDIYTPAGPTMKIFDTTSNAWSGIASSGIPIANKKGYMLFVRGDRSVTAFNQPATETILRTTGQLYTIGSDAPPASYLNAGKYESIGNPYASAIDFNKLTKSGGVQDLFYVWDPKLTMSGFSAYGLGAYQTFIGPGPDYIIIPGGGSYTGNNTKIESGQAFFVHAPFNAGSVSFTESCKANGSNLVTKPVNSTVKQLRNNLYVLTGGNQVLLDGTLCQFDDAFSNEVDDMDAVKLANSSENLGILRDGKKLVAERRNEIQLRDTIFYNLGQLRIQQYQFEFIAANFGHTGLAAFLEDSYLHTSTIVHLNDTTKVLFNIINDPGSYAPDRFRLVFQQLVPTPVNFISVTSTRNRDKSIGISWKVENESNVQLYTVERSENGLNFNGIVTAEPINNNGGSAVYSKKDISPLTHDNYYRIRAMSVDGRVQNSAIVKVHPEKSVKSISVYPNPTNDKMINIHLNGQASGTYRIQLTNKLGQLVINTTAQVQSGNMVCSVPLHKEIVTGNYQLSMIAPDGIKTTLTILIE